jgi:hypothetical protein
MSSIFPLLKDDAVIVIGDFDFEYSEKEFRNDMRIYFREYCNIIKIDEIDAKNNKLHVFRFNRFENQN